MPSFRIDNDLVCTRLKIHGESLRELLLENKWEEKPPKKAEFIFVNTCSFLKKMEEKSIKKILKYKRLKRKDQKIVVFGCLPAINGKRLSGLKKVKRKISYKIGKKLGVIAKLNNILNKLFFNDVYLTYLYDKSKVWHLKICEGCLGKCTFCSERKARGKLRSEKIEKVIREFENGLKMGYKIFSLNADDTGAFGIDNKESIVELLERILAHKENFKLVITEFNPKWLIHYKDRLVKLLSSKKVAFITVPLQSGSNKILELMGREYKVEDVIKILKAVKAKNKKLIVNTHLITGFPGETDEEFKKTLKLLEDFHFNKVKIFKYNERKNTPAARFNNKISECAKEKRRNILKRKIIFGCIKNLNLKEFLLNLDSLK